MTLCVSTRGYCADVGANPFHQSVDMQRGVDTDIHNRGVLPAGYHKDRIPSGRGRGRNLNHAQFTPSLTFDGTASPGRIHIRPGEWSTVAYTVRAPATGSVAAQSYDSENASWRNCGRISWTRTLTADIDDALETRSGQVRFPAGACPGGAAYFITVNARWSVHFDSIAGAAHDHRETNTTTSKWLIECRATRNVAGVCETLSDSRRADIAFGDGGLHGVKLAAGWWDEYSGASADFSAARSSGVEIRDSWPAKWVDARLGPGPWRMAGQPASGVLAYGRPARGWETTAYAVNPRDETLHDCGKVAFRLVSLAWTGGPGGDEVWRRPMTAASPVRGRTTPTWPPGSRSYTWRRYDMNTDDAAAARTPITCTPAWPVLPGGGWENWGAQLNDDNDMTAAQQTALDNSLSACVSTAFWVPVTRTYTTGRGRERACASGDIDITLTAVYEAGVVKDGQPDRDVWEWTRGARHEQILGWTGQRQATAAEFGYWRCPAPGI